MLRELRVSNLALIHGIELELENGLSVLTGETGAGKSILMDAIGLLLGERAHSEQVRAGEEEAEVCGVFELGTPRPHLATLLDENRIALEDGVLIVRRLIQRNGRNRVFVNQVPVPLALLRQIGDHLVDLHGQHEHQSLLHPDAGRQLIDTMPSVAPHVARFAESHETHTDALRALKDHDTAAARLAERRDVIEYQFRELDTLDPKPGEESSLEGQLQLLSSVTDRAAYASEIVELLDSMDGGIEHSLNTVRRRLQALAKLDTSVETWLTELEGVQGVLGELSRFAASYAERTQGQADPKEVESINERLARIQRLKKKYGCDADGLIDKREQLRTDLTSIENGTADRTLLERRLARVRDERLKAAADLGMARTDAAKQFDARISAQMEHLGFAGGAWRTELAHLDEPGPHGMEEIRLTVRTNPGEPFLLLSRTASGGEISRLMLAIKTVLAERDNIPVLIFDEIDTGIGGTLAHEVAQRLRELSRNHQVLCISHLHQIASVAEHHYRVSKKTVKGRAETLVKRLDGEEKIAEVARMLGGETHIARQHARDLLERGKITK